MMSMYPNLFMKIGVCYFIKIAKSKRVKIKLIITKVLLLKARLRI